MSPLKPKSSEPAGLRKSPRSARAKAASRHGSSPQGELPQWWGAYFAALAQLGNRTRAAEAVGIHRTAPRAYIADHPEIEERFREEEREALAAAADRLLAEARRRAVEGCEEPVVSAGKVVTTVMRYSDRLLEMLLKGAMPETFRERHEHTGRDGAPLAPPVLSVYIDGKPAGSVEKQEGEPGPPAAP